MVEMIVLMLDQDGIPRAYAIGDCENNQDLDVLKDVAKKELNKYAASKLYPVDVTKFTMQVEFYDL